MTSSEQPGLFPEEESSPLAGPVKATRWQAVAKAWTTHAQDCGGTSCDSWLRHVPVGSLAKTCLGFCPSTADVTLPSCGQTSHNSVIGGPNGYWTLNTSEFPSDAAASSLSDILQTSGDLSRYYLSPTAAAGILRRAARRGRELPPSLRSALEAVAAREPLTTPPEAD